MFHGKISLNSVLLLLLMNFVSGFRIELIPHRKYQVKPHSSPWFSDACAVDRNHFFRLHQQNKSTELKVKFRQVSNYCKRVLDAAKLAYANKTKESPTSQKFGRIANSVFNRSKFVIHPLFNSLHAFPSRTNLNCIIFL